MKTTLLIAISLLVACGGAPTKTQTDGQYVEAMAEEHNHDAPVANPMSEGEKPANISGEMVQYATVDAKPVSGYFVSPTDKADAPMIVVIHEWWGLNDNIKAMADKLAATGYRVLAVDLYGGVSATTPEDAMTTMKSVMAKPELAQANLKQAIGFLEAKGTQKIGVLGWCFGGAWSLQTGLLAPDKIDAMVIYYGQVDTDKTKLSTLKMPIIGFFGGADKGIPVDGVKAFESALIDVGANAEIKIYPGADHAFANPSGNNYQAEAAEDAWAKTLAFLSTNLK